MSHRQSPFSHLFPLFPARWRVGCDSFLVLVFAAMRSEMALRSVLLIQIGKQNVKIIDLKVEIEKSKNELFLPW